MCLVISKKHHCFNRPRIASKDIKVYKILDQNQENYFTPFWRIPVKFSSGIAELESPLGKVYCKTFNCNYINEGIHAYRTLEHTCFIAISRENPIICTAIIPKGSKYYIGACADVVSTKLIIFEKDSLYTEYKKAHSCIESFKK